MTLQRLTGDRPRKLRLPCELLISVCLVSIHPESFGDTLLSNTNRPSRTVRLVFVHHSTGEAWLADGHGGLGLALRDNNYFVSDTNYGWGPDQIGDTTDIGHWWNWFRGPHSAQYLAALFAETGQNCEYTRMTVGPEGENRVIMFKSCFPNSALQGSPSEPIPPITTNPLRGQDAGSDEHTVANAKGIYTDLLNYFRTRPDKLFVIITAPPLSDPTYANSARAFNEWLVHEWLVDYPLRNVFVWDFYNVLTSNGGNSQVNDVNRETGNHHRWWQGTVQHQTDGGRNVLAYASAGDDDHPSAAGDRKATAEFVPLLNAAVSAWLAPRFASARRVQQRVELTIDGLTSGTVYTIERCPDLRSGHWEEIGTLVGQGDTTDWGEPIRNEDTAMFYRVLCTQPWDGVGPRLFFSDLESGPNRGGQDDLGCFITLWGEGFGASRADSRVTLGGQEVARYVEWGQDNAWARKLDLIVVQPGPGVASGNLEVVVNGKRSNPLHFAVRPGRIFFVSTLGDDANSGDFQSPFRSLLVAKNALEAGDIAYVMDGVQQTEEENFGASLLIENGGEPDRPKALIGFPGARATIGSTNLEFGLRVLNLPETRANDWVISKLVLRGLVQAMELAGDSPTRWRIVGNDISCPAGDGQTGCFAAALASQVAFIGDEGLISRGPGSPKLTLRLQNNIFCAVAGEDYIAPNSETQFIAGSHNLWFGSGAPPVFLPEDLNEDPRFRNLAAWDFSLSPESPAIDAGLDAGSAADHLGVSRPQGTTKDLGAYEFVAPSP
jgi:hypothetical protein